MELIGFSGYARAGKDTAASVLVEEFGFARVAFADKLREVLYALNPLVIYTSTPPGKYWLVRDVIDTYGWDGYKSTDFGPAIRGLLQRLGTEAGREVLGENIWVDSTFNNLDADRVVISDVRFPNEAEAIKERNGAVVRIDNVYLSPANQHVSERALDGWDFDIRVPNNAKLERFKENIRNLAHGWAL